MAFTGGKCDCNTGYTLTGKDNIGTQKCVPATAADTIKMQFPEASRLGLQIAPPVPIPYAYLNDFLFKYFAMLVLSSTQSSAIVVNYYNVQKTAKGPATDTYSVSSLMIQHYYLYAAASCYDYEGVKDLAACQLLGNLCVLQHYFLGTTVRKTEMKLKSLNFVVYW